MKLATIHASRVYIASVWLRCCVALTSLRVILLVGLPCAESSDVGGSMLLSEPAWLLGPNAPLATLSRIRLTHAATLVNIRGNPRWKKNNIVFDDLLSWPSPVRACFPVHGWLLRLGRGLAQNSKIKRVENLRRRYWVLRPASSFTLPRPCGGTAWTSASGQWTRVSLSKNTERKMVGRWLLFVCSSTMERNVSGYLPPTAF